MIASKQAPAVALVVVVILILAVFAVPNQGRASNDEFSGSGVVYNVSNVEVDATASTAVRAREVAILDGHALALNRLLRRLTLPEDWPRLPSLSGKKAQQFSLGYSTTKERNSATRYTGWISVRFALARVQELLRENNIPFGDIQTSPALVVPVFDLPNGRRLVWDSKNIWRDAWGRPDIGESLTPFTLPVGDIEDILSLPAKNARLSNRRKLFALAKRYNTHRVLLAHARLEKVEWKGSTGYALSVRLNLLLDLNNPDSDEVMQFAIAGASSPEALVERGVNDILRMTGIAWKRRIIVHHDEVNENEVEITFSSLLEWQEMRQRMDDVPVLNDYHILRLDNRGALLKFNFTGSREILSLALQQKDIELIIPEDESKPWQLKLQR